MGGWLGEWLGSAPPVTRVRHHFNVLKLEANACHSHGDKHMKERKSDANNGHNYWVFGACRAPVMAVYRIEDIT